MIEKIDAAILAGCTKLSHWLQRMVGITSYFIANIGTVLSVIAMTLACVNYFVHVFSQRISPLLAVCYILIIVAMIHRSLQCMRAQDSLLSGKVTRPAELIPHVMERPAWRVAYIFIFLLDVLSLWQVPPTRSCLVLEVIARTFTWVGMAIFYYFIAVNPLPPGISKVRKLAESLMGTPKIAPASAHN